MKKILIPLLFILAAATAHAQQTPLYSQYFDNPFIYNPAYAGLDRFASVNVSHRSQWAGIKGAPETTLLTFDLPLYDFANGVGMNVMRDKIGYYERYKVMGSFAHHIIGKYMDSNILSFGISAGAVHNRTDYSEAYLQHPNDPKIENNTGSYTGLELSAGMNFQFKDLFQIGVSLPQLLNAGISASDNGENEIALQPHAILAVRCTLKTYDEMHYVEPMFMGRYTLNAPFQMDFGMQYTYNRLFWVNAAYRTDFSAVVAAGLMLPRLRIGIARDFSIGEMNGVSGGSLEFVLGYKFNTMTPFKYPSPKRNSNHRFKRRHPSIPGPMPRQQYMQQNGKKSANKFRKKRG